MNEEQEKRRKKEPHPWAVKVMKLSQGIGTEAQLREFSEMMRSIEPSESEIEDAKTRERWEKEGKEFFDEFLQWAPHEVEARIREYNPTPAAIAGLILAAREYFKKAHAAQNGRRKGDKYRKARNFVLREWKRETDEGKVSKGEFSIKMSRRLLNEMGEKVAPRTIERDWLPIVRRGK